MAGRHRITGTGSNNNLVGTSKDEEIFGLGGNDTLTGAGGNDDLYGGAGTDTAVFSGSFAQYNFKSLKKGMQVTHASGTRTDGKDYVDEDVELLRFRDVTIDLRRNYSPIAIADTNGNDSVRERGGVNNAATGDSTAAGNVLGNDTDIDVTLGRQTLSAVAKTITGTFGTLKLKANGQWTYTLNDSDADTQRLAQGTVGYDVFTYTVRDGAGATATGTLKITVEGSNDAPVITSTLLNARGTVIESGNADDGSGLSGSTTTTGKLTSSDVDAGATATWTIAGASAFGAISITPSGTWTYSLDNTLAATQALIEGETRTETFTAKVTDDKGAQATQIVTVSIKGTNDAPVVQAVTGFATEDGAPIAINLIGDDVDADDTETSLIYSIVNGPDAGQGAAPIVGSVLTFNPGSDFQELAAGEQRDVLISYRATDKHGAVSNTQTATIAVVGTNDAVLITPGAQDGTVIEDDAASASAAGIIAFTDVDLADTHAATFAPKAGTVPTYGTFTLAPVSEAANAASGSVGWNYVIDNSAAQDLAAGEVRTETYTVTIEDGNGGAATQDVVISIVGADDGPRLVSQQSELGPSRLSAFSSDGKFLAIQTTVDDASLGDTNGVSDVYIRNVITGEKRLISVAVDGTAGNGVSSNASVSADGRYVVFESTANDLVIGDGNGRPDFFVRDTLLGTTKLLSGDATNVRGEASISADGSKVVFRGFKEGVGDVFYVADVATGSAYAVPFTAYGDANLSITSNASQIIFETVDVLGNDRLAQIQSYELIASFTSTLVNKGLQGGLINFGDQIIPPSGGGDVDLELIVSGTESKRIASDIAYIDELGNIQIISSGQVSQYSFSADGIKFVIDDPDTNQNAILHFTTFRDAEGDFKGSITTYENGVGTERALSVANDLVDLGLPAPSYADSASDGRFVVYQSNDVLRGDTNLVTDIFVLDRLTGDTKLVSGGLGSQSNGHSTSASISDDGRYIVFQSAASNLVGSDADDVSSIFVYDRIAGTTEFVATAGGYLAGNFSPTISADGRSIAYESTISGTRDVFVIENPIWHDPSAPTITSNSGAARNSIAVAENQAAVTTVIAVDHDVAQTLTYSIVGTAAGGGADGSLFAIDPVSGALTFAQARDFETPTDSDGDNVYDVTIQVSDNAGNADRQTLSVTVADLVEAPSSIKQISVASSGLQANGFVDTHASGQQTSSSDGRFSVFWSLADNLVTGDSNGTGDVFVHDPVTGMTQLVSQALSGSTGNGLSAAAAISAFGGFVVFQSDADNLVVGDNNGAADIFVRDLQTGVTTLVSKDTLGNQARGDSLNPTISADGRFIAFESFASNLVSGDNNGALDVFLHDRLTGETSLISTTGAGSGNSRSFSPTISVDGRFVSFASAATDLTSGEANGDLAVDLYQRDTLLGETKRFALGIEDAGALLITASRLDGTIAVEYLTAGTSSGRLGSDVATVNASGVTTITSNGQVAGFINSDHQLFYRIDDANTATQTISEFSAVSYASGAYLGALQTIDSLSGQVSTETLLVNKQPGIAANRETVIMSLDGRFAAFQDFQEQSFNVLDVYAVDLTTGAITTASTGLNGLANGSSLGASYSADGRYLAFESDASNLVADDTNGVRDIFVRDMTTGTIARASNGDFGQSNGNSYSASISADGSTIHFTSDATNLVSNDTNGTRDLFSVANPFEFADQLAFAASNDVDTFDFIPDIASQPTITQTPASIFEII